MACRLSRKPSDAASTDTTLTAEMPSGTVSTTPDSAGHAAFRSIAHPKVSGGLCLSNVESAFEKAGLRCILRNIAWSRNLRPSMKKNWSDTNEPPAAAAIAGRNAKIPRCTIIPSVTGSRHLSEHTFAQVNASGTTLHSCLAETKIGADIPGCLKATSLRRERRLTRRPSVRKLQCD